MGNDVDITSDDADDFRAYCFQCTSSQLRNVYRKERDAGRDGYARIARWVAEARGVEVD